MCKPQRVVDGSRKCARRRRRDENRNANHIVMGLNGRFPNAT